MFKIFKYLKWHEWVMILLTVGFVALQVWCNISLPQSTLRISQYFDIKTSGPLADNWQNMVKECCIMLGYSAGVVLSAIIAGYFASLVITRLLARTRGKVFEKVNSFSSKEINGFSLPSLITRTTNDITQLQQVLTTFLTMGVSAPLTAIFAIINIVDLSKGTGAGNLSWVNVASVVAISIVVCLIVVTVIPKFKKIQKATDSLNKVTRENLTGLKVVRANRAEKTQEEKFEKENNHFAKLELFVGKIMSVIEPSLTFILQGTSLAIVWVIGFLAKENPATITLMGAFTQYSTFIIMSFTSLSMLFMFLPRGIISGKRISEVLDTQPSLLDGNGNGNEENKGEVIFKNVYFKYPNADEYVLEDISFTAKKGQTIAFIGSTGSGKSTLINLIPRFYDCTEGEIFINGENVQNFNQKDLHDLIGYVPQKGLLFSGTVEENIKYGNANATREEVEKVVEISQSNFVYNFDEGLDHHISQGGKNVSGGQRQRLSIARAIIKNPDILIFDDSFSALDYKTDKTVRRNLNKNYKDTTKLIVAQRVGTIMNADKIIVLNEGKMVGIGKHKDLLKTCEVYKEIALSQLSQEELNK